MELRSKMLAKACQVMRDGLEAISPVVVIDEKGYVADWKQNLLPGIDPVTIERDFNDGAGQELAGKFRAAHSSSALVANCFGPFAGTDATFPIPGMGEVSLVGFEQKFPTGLGGTPPHLDVVCKGELGLVAIESKCLEYFDAKPAYFSGSYEVGINDKRRQDPWFTEMIRLKGDPRGNLCLDGAQLVKHAFGLGRRTDPAVTLLYLFWEPEDCKADQLFSRHRDEIACLADRVAGGHPRFAWMSYPELWSAWEQSGNPKLANHAKLLFRRYGGPLGS